MTRAELKQAAKDQLRGNWSWAILLTFIAWLVIYLLNDIVYLLGNGRDMVYSYVYQARTGIWYSIYQPFTGIFSCLMTIVALMILWGVTYTILHFRDTGEQEMVFSGVFSGFTGGHFQYTFLTSLLYIIFTTLWTMLFIIPGIIKTYSYAMTPYIMKDIYDAGKNPTATEAITKSRNLMNGHKMELFVLDLSFIGWYLLGIITLGIGLLWVIPYYRQTKANFYRKLTNK